MLQLPSLEEKIKTDGGWDGAFDSFTKFVRQHVDEGGENGSNDYCAKMMEIRKMTKANCKPMNTFIHAKKEDVEAVCLNNKPISKNIYKSNVTFSVTICINNKRPPNSPCEYTANKVKGYIKIECDKKKPVRFVDLVPALVSVS
uniref:Ribonuclease pancreatic-like n=1 Tax=Erpetoichthys calabaricus TaxID=27687 RepID=A0A8C4RRX9_ERPCA